MGSSMRHTSRFVLSCALLAGSACGTGVQRNNPFDPDAPVGLQIKGFVAGTVIAEAAFDPEGLSITVDGVATGGQAMGPIAATTAVEANTATFSVELPGG